MTEERAHGPAVVVGIIGDAIGRRRTLTVLGFLAGPTVVTARWTATSATAPCVLGAVVKVTYDLTLWQLFRWVKPAEEVPVQR